MAALTYDCACGERHRHFVGALAHRIFCRAVGRSSRRHWVPDPTSLQGFEAGRGHCYWCLVHEHDPTFAKPCVGRRPTPIEFT